MPVAHVGYLLNGAPVVTPTLQWREGDRIYRHGSAASRMLKTARGMPCCVTVTLTDGRVLARSGLEHSVNYRCVMIFGDAVKVTDATAKAAHLQAMRDQMFPGRWHTLRPMTAQELKATPILSLPLTEASAKISAKISAGPPTDPEEDRSWPVWAGGLPISSQIGAPQTNRPRPCHRRAGTCGQLSLREGARAALSGSGSKAMRPQATDPPAAGVSVCAKPVRLVHFAPKFRTEQDDRCTLTP